LLKRFPDEGMEKEWVYRMANIKVTNYRLGQLWKKFIYALGSAVAELRGFEFNSPYVPYVDKLS
jgi:hypothetical protein